MTSPPSPESADATRRRRSSTSFVGLVGVELRRLWWRRLTKLVLVGVVAFIAVSTYAAFQQTSPSALAQRTADYTTMVKEMKQQEADVSDADRAAQRESCRKEQAKARESDPAVDFRCDQQFAVPTPAEFGIVAANRDGITADMVQSGFPVLGFLALLLGASFVAAEFVSGSMGNWLTFQPRRLRVGASKLIAATLGGLVVGALGVGLAALAAALVTTVNMPPPDLPVGPPVEIPGGSLGLLLVRVVVIAAAAGLGGAVLGLLVRSTAGVIGVALGWLLVVEAFVGAALAEGRLQPWLLRTNIEGFIGAGSTYYATTCEANGCQMTGLPHSYTASWVFLLVLAVAGVTAALASFRSRDVT
ncbi:MAG: ABC transporter permease subunit [Humibacillus sp.]